MSIWKNYHLASTIQDALSALSTYPGPARIIAGGTDLLLDLQQGRHPALDLLVDVTRIPELTCLEMRGTNELFIGAAVPLNLLASSRLISRHARALQEASQLIGGPQVRNVATLGGNVAHALPAADGTIALVALNAGAEIASQSGVRRVPILDLFQGPGKSALDARQELLVGFTLHRAGAGQASAFSRVMRPQGVAIAILNMAIWLERREDRIAEIRLAIGPAGPTPRRALSAEAFLRGKPLEPEVIAGVEERIFQDTKYRDSPHRSSIDYRKKMSMVLLDEVLRKAWDSAVEREEGME